MSDEQDAIYKADFERMVQSMRKAWRNKPENIAAAKQAHAEGMPDIGCWAIACGLMTKDEVEKRFCDIMNESSAGVAP